MATRYGPMITKWLLERGWIEAPDNPELIGDPRVFDPITNEEMSPYKAMMIHKERTGEILEFFERFGF